MRTNTLLVSMLLAASAGACNWTDFDDLESTTWVRSTQDPDIGASQYAVAIVGVSTGTSGGRLAVLSDDSANYSLLGYSADGDADVDGEPIKLGTQNIGAFSDNPVLATDGAGAIGIVERSINGGNFAVVFGAVSAPAGLEFAAVANPAPVPDAGTFTPDGAFVFAAGDTIYSVASSGGTPLACTGVDDASAPLEAAAIAADATRLWVWTKSGTLLAYQPCTATGPLVRSGTVAFASGLAPGGGARIHLAGNFAILTGHPSTSRAGSVFVVDLTAGTQVGATLGVDGLRTSVLADIDGAQYLAVGIPDATVGSDKTVGGKVDVHGFNATSGALDATAAMTLSDASPESGQAFGRALATMDFNGSQILVVGGDDEVFAYYRTALYDHLP